MLCYLFFKYIRMLYHLVLPFLVFFFFDWLSLKNIPGSEKQSTLQFSACNNISWNVVFVFCCPLRDTSEHLIVICVSLKPHFWFHEFCFGSAFIEWYTYCDTLLLFFTFSAAIQGYPRELFLGSFASIQFSVAYCWRCFLSLVFWRDFFLISVIELIVEFRKTSD